MAVDFDRSLVDELLRAITPSRAAEALGIAVVRRGTNLRCLCPFHDDHDPSMVLYDNWGARPPHHHCFVCGADGDIIDMVRHVRHASFGEAVDWLRSSFGLPHLSSRSSRGGTRRKDGDQATWDGSKQTAYNYAAAVYRKHNDHQELSDWLSSRQLPESIATKAGLSFAATNTLTNELSRDSVDSSQLRVEIAMLEEIGLLRRVKRASFSGDLFESIESRFRDFFFDSRVIFPIQSLEGKVIGFAGRVVGDGRKDAPKYLYSPGFTKSSVLYRGHAALELLKSRTDENGRKEIFVCEGLVDALRLESLGYPAVSLLGAQASKEQIDELRHIADMVAPANDLLVHIFLDRDKAGVRGSSKLAIALADYGFNADFIWPPIAKLREFGVSESEAKDPDSLLAVLGDHWSRTFITLSTHPTALPVIAAKLEGTYSTDDLLDDETWNSMSLGTRFRAATALSRDDAEARFLFDLGAFRNSAYEFIWLSDVESLRNTKAKAREIQDEGRSAEFVADENSRLNVARVLAKSGADRGEVPTDEAAWRRLDAGATAFNVGFRERLREVNFEPLEPFDAVFVARDFEKTEPRLKAMPCPEDLVLQQYMLSEVLTERFDVTDENESFSRSIPAVRYYRDQQKTITTAEDGRPGSNTHTLSFAYQIDMDVLEGRSTASNQGMFRPYIECWRDFIASLRTTANGFEEVYALRLDLKRYYDRLYRATVRDALKPPFREAVQRLKNAERFDDFAPSFCNGRQNIADAVIDWFCEQSFGYQYYHPETGRITKAQAGIGIPQGPILSAWLATVALFPLDSNLRRVLESINAGCSAPRAGYARYVDDIFLIADSHEILEQLRIAVEDACVRLRLEAIPKGELPSQMTPDEFRELLTEGKALIGSGPTPEIGLLPLGDGEAGFETWQDPILRASALVLLSDRRLYEADVEAIKQQVFTALTAYDLRPGELPKAARWIWYAVAKEGNDTPETAWQSYWTMWSEVSVRLAQRINVEACPWLDPSLHALDGLERLLSSANTHDRNLSVAAESERKKCIAALSRLVHCDGFFGEFASPKLGAPLGTGSGVRKLRRMFVQRSVGVRWIARQLQPSTTNKPLADELKLPLGLASQELLSSLVRAWLTEADGTDSDLEARASEGDMLEGGSPLRSLFLWLHEAIVLLGQSRTSPEDPLDAICGKLQASSLPTDTNERSLFYSLLSFWKVDITDDEETIEQMRLPALETFIAVCSFDKTKLMSCLTRRRHLLHDIGRPLPALPGIQVPYLVLRNPGPHLRVLTQLFPNESQPPPTDYCIAKASDSHVIPLEWESNNPQLKIPHLYGRQANWTCNASQIWEEPPTKIEKFGSQELKWAADCFESLARINYTLEIAAGEEDVMEFVPAWPFIGASRWTSGSDDSDTTFSLLGPVVPKKQLGVSAFTRDGRGRLRTHEVPLADASLWRIGYAVTDALGMVDELERFRALEADGKTIEINTAQHVLSRLLARLRGEGLPPTPGLRHPARPHLTGSTYRALQLMRNFPESTDETEHIQYLLSVEAETAAMRLQRNGYSNSTRPGVLASLLAELAPLVFLRLTEKQLEPLPPMASVDGPNGAERRVVAAWRLLDRRLGAVESRLVGRTPIDSICSWSALRRSIRVAAVVAWIRALVFEMYLSDDAIPDSDVTVPIEWLIEEPILAMDSQDTNVGELFRDSMAPKRRMAISAQITPIGWLALLANQLNLYGTETKGTLITEAKAEELRPLMTLLAQQLAAFCTDEELANDKWPFDAYARIESIFDEQSFESSLHLLFQIESELGYTVRQCQSYIWGLQPQLRTFSDANGRQWKLVRGLIDQVGRDRYVETISDENHKRIWTETTTRDGKLIGVSVLGEKFAKTVGMQGNRCLFIESLPAAQSGLDDRPDNLEPPEVSASKCQDDEPIRSEGKNKALNRNVPSSTQDEGPYIKEIASSDEFFKRFREYQNREWKTRRAVKSEGHVRFALFQFRIDESYSHPMVDVGFPDAIDKAFCKRSEIESENNRIISAISKEDADASSTPTISPAQRIKASLSRNGVENLWSKSGLLPSWNEHRRRKLLDEALRACDKFGVDVLVLPEYSVRPDTVEWLRNRLKDLGTRLSVVAGTYRLHGTPRDLHFKESFQKIFGADDQRKVFDGAGNSMEKSAYITLLQPMSEDGLRGIGVFSRRKKYHSMAMGEFINPADEQWAPLASLKGLVRAIVAERQSAFAPPLEVERVTTIAQEIRAVDRMAELICSELFASTHPVNHATIFTEYNILRQRFGYAPVGKDENVVLKDIEKLTKALLLDSKVDRRTILVVPACTSRSADYWIYGQAALLAAGLTTVFCTAVLKDSKGEVSGGGSCVIARSSWLKSKEQPGHLELVTPYSGWTRGIYYNRSEDVLSRKEQAIVIADIDPTYMNEGKPRPQALPIPVQLVAHLPVVEMVNEEDFSACYKQENGGFELKSPPPKNLLENANINDLVEAHKVFQEVAEYLEKAQPNRLIDARTKLPSGKILVEQAACLEDFFFDASASGWRKRLECWSRNWREMPFYGPPPTLIDWLPVDLSPKDGKLPHIFVPPWSSDLGETASLVPEDENH